VLREARYWIECSHRDCGGKFRDCSPAGTTANTVTRIENGADAKQSTIVRLQHALEAADVEFTNGDQPGVRLSKAAAARAQESPSALNPPVVVGKAASGKTAKATNKKR
jgi:hypothetical protein